MHIHALNPYVADGTTEFHFIAVDGNRARWTLTDTEIDQLFAEAEAKLSTLPVAERREHALRVLSQMAVADIRDDEASEWMKRLTVWLLARSGIAPRLMIGGLAQCGYLVLPAHKAGETRRFHAFGTPRFAH